MLSQVSRNKFARAASVLVGGTAAAQALTILALPILTRIYSPEEFSLLAVYVALLTMLSVVSCLRLEIAIPLPEDDDEAINLLALALSLAAIFASLILLGMLACGPALFELMGQPRLEPYGWLFPAGVWLAGSYAALQYWATRKHRFSIIAGTRIKQSSSGLVTQLGLGWVGAGPVGLLIGHALTAGSGVMGLAWQTWRKDRTLLTKISSKGMIAAFRNYRRFPLYSTLEALANTAAIQAPVFLIATLAAGPEAGFVLLATRALGTPVTLIGSAVSQVYLTRASTEMRSGQLSAFTTSVLLGLAKVGVAPLCFLAVIAPSFFALIFGDEWRRAGELVAWMVPWFVLKLMSSPVSMVMHVKMMQRAMLVLMVVGLFIRLFITMGAYVFDQKLIAQGYALSGAVHYLLAFSVYVYCADASFKDVWRIIMTLFFFSAIGLLAGLAFVKALTM